MTTTDHALYSPLTGRRWSITSQPTKSGDLIVEVSGETRDVVLRAASIVYQWATNHARTVTLPANAEPLPEHLLSTAPEGYDERGDAVITLRLRP